MRSIWELLLDIWEEEEKRLGIQHQAGLLNNFERPLCGDPIQKVEVCIYNKTYR